MTRHIRVLAFACAIAGASTPLWAQSSGSTAEPDPAALARFHFGVLRFTPAIAVTNVGIDNNVFNSPVDPKADTTAAVGPVVDLWLKTGPGRLSGTVGGQYLYFKTYGNQRAWNTNDQLRWELTNGRIRPFVTGGYANTKDRPGFEIDSRVRLKQQVWSAGANILIGGRSRLLLEGGQTQMRFDQGQNNYGVAVAQTLDRRTDVERAQFRTALTPLTTWVLSAETMQENFTQAVDRDADGIRVTTGFELRPAALIAGQVLVGYRRLDMLARGQPDFNGLSASGTVTMIIARTNRLSISELRDVNFSYDANFPFYVMTSTTASLQHRIGVQWDVVARGGYTHLGYKSATAAFEPSDRVSQVGAGVGYIVGSMLRLGLDANYYTRTSESGVAAEFSGFRAGLSISYGMPK